MKEYGYMEGGYLRSRMIEPIVENYVDGQGKPQQRIVSEEEQIAALSPEWKPVDPIDHAQVEGAEAGYIIIPTPYDGGDHIGYDYVLKRDKQTVRAEIQSLKDSLADSDYQITKCYEASLIGEPLPYDIAALHAQRQRLRDRINELEAAV